MPMIDISSEKTSGPMTRPMTPNACTTRSRIRRGSRPAARAASGVVSRVGEEVRRPRSIRSTPGVTRLRAGVRGVELPESRARREEAVKTVYFDTNAFVDVFEDRKPGRYATVQDLVRRGLVRPVASDALLKELV